MKPESRRPPKRSGAPVVRIHWKRYASYEEAQDCHRVIYLFEGKGRPYYWGKADRSYFGGNKRPRGDGKACGRYCPSYDHLITAFLMLGGRLYIGEPTLPDGVTLDDVEDLLTRKHEPEIPARPGKCNLSLRLRNSGELPECLRRHPKR